MDDPFAAAIRRGRLRPPSEYGTERIDAAIDSYAVRAGSGGPGDENVAYSASFLAEIYGPRVQELFDLQAQGFTYAKWGWDETLRENRWHGVADGEVRA